MRAIGVEKSATVGTQHLDCFLRSDRALRDHLVCNGVGGLFPIWAEHWFSVRSDFGDMLRLDNFYCVIRPEILDAPLRDQYQGIDNAGR